LGALRRWERLLALKPSTGLNSSFKWTEEPDAGKTLSSVFLPVRLFPLMWFI
jgi:hypothetical protein